MPQFRIPLLAMFKRNGFVPKKTRLIVSLCGVMLVLMFTAVSLRMIWDAELDELVFGFVGMFLLLAVLMIHSGANDDGKSDSDNGDISPGDHRDTVDADAVSTEGSRERARRGRHDNEGTEGESRCQ